MTPSDYINGLSTRLAADGCDPQTQQWGSEPVLVGRRSDFRVRWMATKLHLFVIAAAVPVVTVEAISQFMATTNHYARQNKGGLPGGFQTGVAVFPALISDNVDPAAADWANAQQRNQFACISRPVVVDTSTGTVSQFRRTAVLGGIYSGFLRSKGELYFPATDPNPTGR
jgi:hypothetical protein